MDPATFVVTTLAGALLKEVASDSYNAVKARLVSAFSLEKAIEVLEDAPGDQDARDFAAKRLAKSPAIQDAEVIDGAVLIAGQLEKLPEDTHLVASLTVRDLKTEVAEFRRNRIRSGAAVIFQGIESKRLVVEDNHVGDDRKH